MNVTKEDIVAAVKSATERRMKRGDVVRLYRHYDRYIDAVYAVLQKGTWRKHLRYRELTKVNNNGKVRHIKSPNLCTLILQHLANHLILPIYNKVDPNFGLNCKPGHGITANIKRFSVIKRLKHIYYDRRDLRYAVIIDQRRCYDHISVRMLRKALKELISDKWLIDYITSVTFYGKVFPVGTPTSPVMHHIIMLSFDRWLMQVSPMAVRYADDVFLPFSTLEEARAAMWRVKQFWWYTYRLRSKGFTQRVTSIDRTSDFCGYIVHRNPDKITTQHDKGFTSIRRGIYTSAVRCKTSESYSSYFGLLKQADLFRVMSKIETSNMNLKQLTDKIRIDRELDADPISIRELIESKQEFTIYDYDLRRDARGEANWIKCLIGYPEKDKEGTPTGKILAREYHGGGKYLIEFHEKCEKQYGKEALLPMTGMILEDRCGYIYQGSTNVIKYIDK